MLSVNIVDFRKNLAEYLRLTEYRGESIKIFDKRRKKVVAELNPSKNKDNEGYLTFVKNMCGAWKDFPEDKNRKALRKADRLAVRRRLKA